MDTRIMPTYNYNKRLAYSFRRAAKAMAVTSSTTAVAFFANGLSKIPVIASFGWFAGVIVPVNYLLIIMIFPPAIIWYEKHIIGKVSDENGIPIKDENGKTTYKRPCCICFGKCKKPKDQEGEQLSSSERFFDEKVNWFVGHSVIKWVIILLSVAWFGVSIYLSSQIEGLSRPEEWFDPESEYMITFTKIEKNFD